MKLIDEKGRLFGKVNIIDLVVALVLLLVVAAVGYKVLSPKIASSPTAKGEITATVKCTFRTDAVAKSIEKGQQLVFGTDFINDATITDVKAVPADYTSVDAQGNVHYVKHPVLKDIYITIKAKTNTNVPILKVGSQEICEAKKFTVKTKTLEIEGTVEDITVNK